MRDHLPLCKWNEVVREFGIRELNRNGNFTGENYDGVEAGIMACYAVRNFEQLRALRDREAVPKEKQDKGLRPLIRVEVPFVAPVGVATEDAPRRKPKAKRLGNRKKTKSKERKNKSKKERKTKTKVKRKA
jgi:hypothetical protein